MKIGDKYFLNLQEAVGWLLANNALPFQSTANYVANTEIAKSTIINPSPAEIKVGALVLFADSKIGTVSGLTSNGFMVGSEYTDIKNVLAYIVNVAINNSNHLITTFSDGTIKDAGLIKEVSSMSINGSQHLIVNYNDGTTNDLGAIFSGNINVSGNFSVSGGVSGNAITGNSIIENMNGYSYTKNETANVTYEYIYAGVVKNGNKITFVIAANVTRTDASVNTINLGRFEVPSAVYSKLYPTNIGYPVLDIKSISAFKTYLSKEECLAYLDKSGGYVRGFLVETSNLEVGTKYYIRYEATFLLSDSLVS